MFSWEKKAPAGLHHTQDRAGDAPSSPFPWKSIKNQQNSNNQPPNQPYKLSPIPESTSPVGAVSAVLLMLKTCAGSDSPGLPTNMTLLEPKLRDTIFWDSDEIWPENAFLSNSFACPPKPARDWVPETGSPQNNPNTKKIKTLNLRRGQCGHSFICHIRWIRLTFWKNKAWAMFTNVVWYLIPDIWYIIPDI